MVKPKLVADALRLVGQRFAVLGAADLRFNLQGKIEFRIEKQMRGYTKMAKPMVRVKPLPIHIVLRALEFGL